MALSRCGFRLAFREAVTSCSAASAAEVITDCLWPGSRGPDEQLVARGG
jgi:hypothetical protein